MGHSGTEAATQISKEDIHHLLFDDIVIYFTGVSRILLFVNWRSHFLHYYYKVLHLQSTPRCTDIVRWHHLSKLFLINIANIKHLPQYENQVLISTFTNNDEVIQLKSNLF